MHFLVPNRTGHDSRGAMAIFTPGTRFYLMQTAVAPREKTCVPSEKTVLGERLVEILRGIQHHLHHAIDMPVGGNKPGHVQTEFPRDGRPHLTFI